MEKKSLFVAYMLWLFLGFFGIHKFYLGKTGWGLVYIFTGGLFTIGWIIDLFTLPGQVENYNLEIEVHRRNH
ncbi:TM2 domain-containing protein [Pontibacter sp. G13]|uniref:TM2 domain-containing protein n=1 Tax=Pontibacter sp. G13 TaxID=3074898 RepID=UPI00288B5A05|nr:TM2 domain-containing protein [Pontibacter sp. G13]WNJ20997.1 TM2 domain-containing protein [Pontibacter sp. G13]